MAPPDDSSTANPFQKPIGYWGALWQLLALVFRSRVALLLEMYQQSASSKRFDLGEVKTVEQARERYLDQYYQSKMLQDDDRTVPARFKLPLDGIMAADKWFRPIAFRANA